MVVLLSEVKEGAGDSGVVRNEVAVEVGKAKEGAHFPDLSGGRPAGDSIELHWVHG